ncbi:MAG: TetR/AcrR family transcriptional regulator [Providencia sp.]|uniref:TetR/AcrR family transcriptional regulator n=1 Tax=Providencia sp. TaxID=589 RepID=UPI003F9E67A3
MTQRSRGRPKASEPQISPEDIITYALLIIDRDGFDNLTMRALAKEMNINPMTIYHHFQDRSGLIKAIANSLYANIIPTLKGTNSEQIEAILLAYRTQVTRYPALTLAIFNLPNAFPEQAKKITEKLVFLLEQRGLHSTEALQWTHILVDYTHGESLSVTKQPTISTPNSIEDNPELTRYRSAINMLINNLKHGL